KKRYLYSFSLKGSPVFEKELTDMLAEYKKAEADADAEEKKMLIPFGTRRRRNSFLRRILAGTEPGYKTTYARWRECGNNLFGGNRKEFEKKCLFGADLDAVLAIEAANEYLSQNMSVEFRPRKTIDVIMLDKIPNSTASALTVNPYTSAPYVQLSKDEFVKFRDSAFVTTGHEILHVWQAYAVFIDHLSYSSFWEAHALYFEREYTDWLFDTKKLIHTKPGNDQYGNNYEYLAFGSEYMPGYWDAVFGDKKTLNMASQSYGYTRGRLFYWLEDKKDSLLSLSSMVHSFKSTGTFYGAATGGDIYKKINSGNYNKLYVEWCQSLAGKMYERLPYSANIYKQLNIKLAEASAAEPKASISYTKIPHLSSFIQQFKTPENEYAWILVKTSKNASAMNPFHVLGIYSAAGYQDGTNKKAAVVSGLGRYYFAGNLDPADAPKTDSLYIQFTVVMQTASADLSFDAYLLTKPETPEVVFEADGGCTVKLPEKSVSLEDGATDGYRIIIEDEKGSRQNIDVPTEDIKTPVKIDKNRLGSGAVKITVCEYAILTQEVTGPHSDAATKATVKIEGERVIEYKPDIISEDEPVRHTFTAVAAPEGLYDFVWDFGDKETETEEGVSFSYVTHEYKTEGDFKPTVTLRKDGKELAKDTVIVNIKLDESRLIYTGTLTTTSVELKGDYVTSPQTVGEVQDISFVIDITNESTGACTVTLSIAEGDTVFYGNLTKNSNGGRHFEKTMKESMGGGTVSFDISGDGKQLTGTLTLIAEIFGMGSTCTYSIDCEKK
ncbi:MAG: PKD domain-containing protein, partial [Oscillospiraceae bacterium]|nr:PKD domain-containing protein [Oscillospiraceae bacterium]